MSPVPLGSFTRAIGTVHVLFEDHEGSVWIGADRGIVRRTPNGRVVSYALQTGGRSLRARAMLETEPGSLWIGTRERVASPEARSGGERASDGCQRLCQRAAVRTTGAARAACAIRRRLSASTPPRSVEVAPGSGRWCAPPTGSCGSVPSTGSTRFDGSRFSNV